MTSDDVVKLLRQIRRYREVTQKQLAAKLGLKHHTSVTMFERGKAEISMKQLFQIAEALDCTVSISIVPKDKHND